MADILVAAESAAQAESLRALLDRGGHSPRIAASGRGALDMSRAEPADLVISDMMLPDMTGCELCGALKDDPDLRRIPVILLGALGEPEEIVDGLNARADACLTRPCDPDYLLSRIGLLLAHPSPPPPAPEDVLDVELRGKHYKVCTSRLQMLNLLVSTCENAVHQTRALSDTQLELRDLNERISHDRNLLRTLIDTLPDSIYVKDAESRYLLDNYAHTRLVGAPSPGEVVGRTAFDFFPREMAERYHSADHEVIETGRAVIDLEEPMVTPDGVQRWISTTKMPFRDDDGSVLGIVCMGRDITERKRAEEQLASYAEELRLKNGEMLEDLNMARELQLAFLPQQALCFPLGSGAGECALRISHQYLPSTAIGGDYFEPLWLSDTRAGLILGDVMGHGVRAALVTAILRGMVEELRPHAADPARFLSELNRGLVRVLGQTRIPIFSSAFYIVIDTSTGDAVYANAGHPSPLLLRGSTASALPRGADSHARPGTALGVLAESTYTAMVTRFEAGDRLLLFTDGLFEVEGQNGDFYDERRMLEAIRMHADLPTDRLFQAVIQATRAFSLTRNFDDDMCLVGIDIRRVGRTGERRID